MANTGVIQNGVKMVGEVILPGTSLLLDGDIKGGAGHAIVGLATWAYLGPVRLLVSANSFSKSVSDKHLYRHLLDLFSSAKDTVSEGVSGRRNAGAGDAGSDDPSAEGATAPA